MAQETRPVHISEILPDVLSHLKQTSKVKCFPAIKGEAQLSVAGVFPAPADREPELTLLFGILTEKRKCFATILHAISSMELPDTEYLKLYLKDMHRRNCKPVSITSTAHALKHFLGFLSSLGRKKIEEVTRVDLEAFVEHKQDRGLKIRSVRTYLSHAHAFLNYLTEEEIVSAEILRKRIWLRLPQDLPRAIDPDNVARLLAVRGPSRDRALILVLLRTGMRIGELLETKISDVNLKERTITIWQGVKNRRARVVYFSDDARDTLKEWLKRRDATKGYLFYPEWGDRMPYGGAHYIFRKYLAQADLTHRGYTLHCLRHTFASEMLNAGMRLESLQQILGHDCVEMTRRYARLTDKTRREEYFRAMQKIERGEIHGSYRLDSELQKVLKEKELFSLYHKELSS